MTFTICEAEQRSPEWFAARLGRLTGSRAGDMLAQIKSGEAAARRDYRLQLACERLTGQSQENGYVNAEMQRGIDLEPRAFAAYEALTGNLAQRVGFMAADIMAGCSPDGIVGAEGLLELKCPKSATHLRYLRAGTMPSEHVAQVTHNLWIAGMYRPEIKWCDFLSFDDRFPGPLQTFLVRVNRDEDVIATYEQRALAFLAEVEAEVEAVTALTKGR